MAILVLSAFFGLMFGSFISMASYRLPRGEDIVFRRSHCPKCQHALGVKDLVPLFSWVFHKGRCAYCQQAVSVRYPLIEIATALLFSWIIWQLGISWMAPLLMVVVVALMIMIVTDFEHYLIPDSVHCVLGIGAIFYALLLSRSFFEVLEGGLLGMLTGLGLRYGFWLWKRKEGLGWGDIKFLSVAGLYLLPIQFPVFLLLSGVMGIVTGMVWRFLKKGPLFPFGPALAMAFILCVIDPAITLSFYKIVADGARVFIKH